MSGDIRCQQCGALLLKAGNIVVAEIKCHNYKCGFVNHIRHYSQRGLDKIPGHVKMVNSEGLRISLIKNRGL